MSKIPLSKLNEKDWFCTSSGVYCLLKEKSKDNEGNQIIYYWNPILEKTLGTYNIHQKVHIHYRLKKVSTLEIGAIIKRAKTERPLEVVAHDVYGKTIVKPTIGGVNLHLSPNEYVEILAIKQTSLFHYHENKQ